MNAKNRDSYHQLFKKLKILPLKSQYIFSLLLFIAKNRDLYESNSEIHNINTIFSSDLHTPTANLTTFQKGPFYFGIKVLNHLPTSIKNASHDIRQFSTYMSRCSDRFHFQFAFKFCIVIYYIILDGCPYIIICVVKYKL